MRSLEELVNYLERYGYVKSPEIKKALLEIDRKDFVPEQFKDYAYIDEPIPIGKHQTTSAPSVIAKTLELLELRPGLRVLEIGTGSGYLTALLAKLVGPSGLVVSVEYYPELLDFARANLAKYGFKNIVLLQGDGSLGCPEYAPYDRVVWGAAAPYPVPRAWVEQSKNGAVLVGPVKYGMDQWIFKFRKLGNRLVVEDRWGPVIFVPLRGKYGFD